jgi:hypothetical protein
MITTDVSHHPGGKDPASVVRLSGSWEVAGRYVALAFSAAAVRRTVMITRAGRG